MMGYSRHDRVETVGRSRSVPRSRKKTGALEFGKPEAAAFPSGVRNATIFRREAWAFFM